MLKKFIIGFSIGVIILLASREISSACTIFTVSDNVTVYFGNNEDYSDPNTYYWADIPEDGKYDGIYFGFDNF